MLTQQFEKTYYNVRFNFKMDFFCLTFDVADQYRGADPALF